MAVNPRFVEMLALVHERSPEGLGIPLTTCEEAGVDADSIKALRQEGLVEVVEDDGEPTLIITEEGRNLLRP
jgi:hypothetical protein